MLRITMMLITPRGTKFLLPPSTSLFQATNLSFICMRIRSRLNENMIGRLSRLREPIGFRLSAGLKAYTKGQQSARETLATINGCSVTGSIALRRPWHLNELLVGIQIIPPMVLFWLFSRLLRFRALLRNTEVFPGGLARDPV